jgi:hypothetical protein
VTTTANDSAGLQAVLNTLTSQRNAALDTVAGLTGRVAELEERVKGLEAALQKAADTEDDVQF